MSDKVIKLFSDYVVEKEDDEILKKWVMIGHHFFKQPVDPSEVRITAEYGELSIDVDEENFRIYQFDDKGIRINKIMLYNCIDRTDAYRLAGMLIAWASEKSFHFKENQDE